MENEKASKLKMVTYHVRSSFTPSTLQDRLHFLDFKGNKYSLNNNGRSAISSSRSMMGKSDNLLLFFLKKRKKKKVACQRPLLLLQA